MAVKSQYWKFDSEALDLDAEISALCDLRFDVYEETYLSALNAGLWWIYPIGRSHASHLIGLHLRPGTKISESPVVRIGNGAAVTLCSRPGVLVPTRIFDGMVGYAPRWQELAALTDAKWASAVALHRALGGEDDLGVLRSIVTDRSLESALLSSDHAEQTRAIAEARIRIDPALDTAACWRYTAEFVIDHAQKKALPEAGLWNIALASLVVMVVEDEGEDASSLEIAAHSAWRVLQGPLALDTSRVAPGMTMDPSVARSAKLIASAAKIVVARPRSEWENDPRMVAARALAATEPDEGDAYVASAQALQSDDAEGAFDALTNAAFLSYCANEVARSDVASIASSISRSAGASDIADVIDQQQAFHEQLKSGEESSE